MKKIIIFLLITCSIFAININADEFIAEEIVEKINVSLTIEKEVYTYVEEIVIIINNINLDNNPQLEFIEDGLEVVDINITSDETILKVQKSNVNKKASLEIIVTVNGIDYCVKAYSYYDEQYGVFLSRISYDDAFEIYCDYLQENNYINSDEYTYLRETHYSQYVNMPIPMLTMVNMSEMELMSESSGNVYISGEVTWEDDWGFTHKCGFVKVELWNKNTILDTKIDDTYTDSMGFYSFSFNNGSFLENGGYDIYVKVYAVGEGVIVENNSNDTYYYSSRSDAIINVISGGVYTGYDVDFEMNSDMGKAFQISQAAITGYRYAKTMNENYSSNETINNVKVLYPYDDGDEITGNEGCFYSNSEERIYLCGDAISVNSEIKPYSAWDVIMHEYGHHIQNVFNLGENPATHHDLTVNMADHYYEHLSGVSVCNDCVEDDIVKSINECKSKGIRLAWAEGWATYFAFAAQDYYSSTLMNVRYLESGVFNGYSSENDLGTDLKEVYTIGEGCEATVISILYHLYDSNNNNWDTFSLGHQNIWNYTRISNANTLSEFINYLINNNKVDEEDMWLLFDEYYLSQYFCNVSNVHLDYLPKFIWNAGGDGSLYFPNDEFILVIADSNGNEILRKNNLSSTSYTLTELEWNQVLAAQGDTFKWRVIGFATEDEETGPYSSSWAVKGKPSFNGTLIEGTSMSGTITSSADYKWYKFTAPSAGTYVFYTEGNVDTYGQLYNSLAYKDSTYNMISGAYNDNGGSSNNCLIEIDLTNGQIVYFKVKGVNNSIGNFTVQVHKHNYLYQWLNLTQHNKTCTCGEIIQEGHVVSSSALNNGQTTAPCLLCGGMANIGFIEIQNNIVMISDNGSYILSNGIVVLVDSDIESYLNNTLVFRNPNEDIM